MPRDALDVARTRGAGAASRYAFTGRPEQREELRGELVQLVEECVDDRAAGDEPGAEPQRRVELG